MNKQIINEINNIEYSKSKYFIIGFFVGILPYILLISILLIISKDSNNIPLLYRNTIIIISIITSISNAIILSKYAYNKLIKYFENKYNIKYKILLKEIKSNQ